MSSSVQRYTQSMHHHSPHDSQQDEWDAAQIANHPWLYIGSLSAAESHIHQEQYNIKRILTVARNLPMKPVPDFVDEHRIVKIDDHPKANFLDDAARQCLDFIDVAYHEYLNYLEEMKSDKEKNEAASVGPPPSLLVHCASGISRSSTAILVWLMSNKDGIVRKQEGGAAEAGGSKSSSLKLLDTALQMTRKNRPLVHPNIGFMMQLQVLEKHSGNLEKAIAVWNSDMKTEIYDHVSNRRRTANHIHEQVDEIEVEIQMYQSQKRQHQEEAVMLNNEKGQQCSILQQKLNKISEQLDMECDENAQMYPGIPEDRVAKMIFKSARNKVERLFVLVS